jgi:AraC-like DNA-binding protein
MIPYFVILVAVIMFTIVLVYLYDCRKKRNLLNKNIIEYIKSVHELHKSLDQLKEPLNDVSLNAGMEEMQRDKVRIAIWRINTIQTSINHLIALEKDNEWLKNQLQLAKVGETGRRISSEEVSGNEQDSTSYIHDTPGSGDRIFLDKVFSIIRESYVDVGFNVDILSHKLGMSRSSFYNKIKAITGQAPADFIRQYRMERAKELLKTKQYTISEVAFMSGFTDVKYFRDVFRKKYDQSPSEYSKSIQS